MTHYFWVISRTARLDEAGLDAKLREFGARVFDTEDCPMIAAQQEAMGEATDYLTQRPIILKADAAGVRARLILKNLIRAEQRLMTEQPGTAADEGQPPWLHAESPAEETRSS